MTNDWNIFINHINDNYNDIKNKLTMLSARNGYQFDEDAYQEVILRCYDRIKKKGKLNDTSPYGIESYLIKAYVNFLTDEKRACRNSKRDKNVTNDNIDVVYEQYYNDNNKPVNSKIARDLFTDYSVLYIILKVEQNFDRESAYLFRIKSLSNLTYKQLANMTGMKGVRTKVIAVKNWLRSNVTKEEIRKSFQELYGEIIPD